MADSEDKVERLSAVVLSVARDIASRGNGKTVTIDEISAAMAGVNRRRLTDALKTLKDNGALLPLGRLRGIYVLRDDDVFPAMRQISLTALTDGWTLIEVGEISLALTPQEASELGSLLTGRMTIVTMSSRLASIERSMSQIAYERDCALRARVGRGNFPQLKAEEWAARQGTLPLAVQDAQEQGTH